MVPECHLGPSGFGTRDVRECALKIPREGARQSLALAGRWYGLRWQVSHGRGGVEGHAVYYADQLGELEIPYAQDG